MKRKGDDGEKLKGKRIEERRYDKEEKEEKNGRGDEEVEWREQRGER